VLFHNFLSEGGTIVNKIFFHQSQICKCLELSEVNNNSNFYYKCIFYVLSFYCMYSKMDVEVNLYEKYSFVLLHICYY
jgi:hypothetical protein